MIEKLSRREYQVIELSALGYIDKEIAIKLGIGYQTVKTYAQHAMIKLGASNRPHAVANFIKYTGGDNKLV